MPPALLGRVTFATLWRLLVKEVESSTGSSGLHFVPNSSFPEDTRPTSSHLGRMTMPGRHTGKNRNSQMISIALGIHPIKRPYLRGLSSVDVFLTHVSRNQHSCNLLLFPRTALGYAYMQLCVSVPCFCFLFLFYADAGRPFHNLCRYNSTSSVSCPRTALGFCSFYSIVFRWVLFLFPLQTGLRCCTSI